MSSLNEGSHHWYLSVARAFDAHLDSYSLSLSNLPSDSLLSHLINFMSTLTCTSWSKEIYRVASALKHYLSRLNMLWPTSPYLKLLISGIAKTSPPPKHRPRSPLLPQHLFQIYKNTPDPSSFDFLRPFAVLTLALRFGLRPCEVAAMERDRVILLHDKILFTFRRFKALSYPVFEHNRPLHPAPDHFDLTICPFRILKLYISLRDASAAASSSALFPRSATDSLPITASDVNDIAKSLAATVSLSAIHGHSPRIGNATSLTLLGYPIAEIKSQGNWGKSAYLRYIRNSRSWPLALTDKPLAFFPPPNG